MLALGMLLGSIPVGYLLVRLSTGSWPKETGLGALDVRRRLGVAGALLVPVLDVAKGLAPVWIAKGNLDSPLMVVLVGVVTILSHCFPYWFLFRPMGKGMAVGLGVVLALSPAAGLLTACVWLLSLLLSQRLSVATMIAAVSIPIWFRVFGSPSAFVWFGLAGLVCVVISHLPNIACLAKGTELRFRL